MNTRGSGVLLHISSLPSRFGIGDLGPEADEFLNFLHDAKQMYWQILPINPTDPAYDNSPYHSISAFAANPLFISPEQMVSDGLLDPSDISDIPEFPKDWVDYEAVIAWKEPRFDVAYERFRRGPYSQEYERFLIKESWWLDDFALFTALKKHFSMRPWTEWPNDLKYRDKVRMAELKAELYENIERAKFIQFLFSIQWKRFRDQCRRLEIRLIGDIPIYVDYDSVDVWANPELFKLDEEMRLIGSAGVPPDYYSETGQLWGNPLYRWEKHQATRFNWWVKRVRRSIDLVDYIRIDHFRGLVGYFEIPQGEETAINGSWKEAPAYDLLSRLQREFPCLPILAEDLGVITPDVREVIHKFEITGMKVLLFAFGWDMGKSPYIPHNFMKNCIVYPGTHDNNSVRGWLVNEASSDDKRRLYQYFGKDVHEDEISWALIRLAFMSVANTVIIQMQDLLSLGAESRMNRPGPFSGNWRWRLCPGQINGDLVQRLRELTEITGRG